jgi:hypothetical protein
LAAGGAAASPRAGINKTVLNARSFFMAKEDKG